MLLVTSIVILLFYIGVYIFLNKVYGNPIKNRRAHKEFKFLLRLLCVAKTKSELKSYEEWFFEFILAYELTDEEKTWYYDMFFDIYSRRLVKATDDV